MPSMATHNFPKKDRKIICSPTIKRKLSEIYSNTLFNQKRIFSKVVTPKQMLVKQ